MRQTIRRHKDLFPKVQIHQSESYVSVEELVALESLATQSLELGLFQLLPRFHYFDPFYQEARSRPYKLAAAHHTVGS